MFLESAKSCFPVNLLMAEQTRGIRTHSMRCMSVYRNPDGTREGLDEYVSKYEVFVISWTVMD